MKKKKFLVRIMAILLVAAMVIGSGFYLLNLFACESVEVYGADLDAYDKLNDLGEIIKIIEANYKEDVDVNKLVEAAYRGVFNSLDKWSTYYASLEEEQNFVSTLSNEEYCGIGVTITKIDDGNLNVNSLNPKGSAIEAGLKRNDTITMIDGKPVKDMTLEAAGNAMRGKEGTKVKLTILRKNETLEFTIKRIPLVATSVTVDMLEDGKIAYIFITSFNEDTASDFIDVYLDALDAGAEKFILDIRCNPGGYMSEALNCAAALLKSGSKLLYYFQGTTQLEEIFVDGDDTYAIGYPTVILVNEDTASAAEAFAAAMQDNKAATIVGVTSYGKGVAQQIFSGGNGDSFKLSTCYFTGPNKKQLDGVGVKPDVVVYNNGGLTDPEADAIAAGVVPMNENKKYLKLNAYGLNVLGAQQRLNVLGYDVKANGILDQDTITALKDVQRTAGLGVYGMLDFSTMKALEARYQAYLYGTEDAQLAKAIEILK